MFKRWISLCLQIALVQFNAGSQSNLKFDTFKGTVYDIPGDYLSEGYGPHVSYFDVLGQVSMDSLAVPKTFTYVRNFPGTSYATRFGIVFLSGLDISEKGCYEFYLESDDGSILWIDDSLVIDNDKIHKMTIKRDTILLDKGHHGVKVWYYNAHETQYGLIMRGKALPDSVQCGKAKRMVTLDLNNVLFDFDSYVVTPPGKKELDKLCADLGKSDFKKIDIIGYTDNVGSDPYNKELSLKRAQSIMAYMKTKLTKSGIVWKAEGRGSSNPLVSGGKSEAQQMNRRVEIYIE